jgi:hypothetical protein
LFVVISSKYKYTSIIVNFWVSRGSLDVGLDVQEDLVTQRQSGCLLGSRSRFRNTPK